MKNNEIKNILEAFGFVTDEARRNLVVFIMVILVFSNAYFIWRNALLMEEIKDLNEENKEIILILSKQITEEVRRQITPTTSRINETITKLDSVAVKTETYLNKK